MGRILAGGWMQQRVRTAGWGLVLLAVTAAVVVVTVSAYGSHGGRILSQWAFWATVAALSVAAVGVVLALLERASQRRAPPELQEVVQELSALVLAQAQVARSELIGSGRPDG